MCQQRSTTTQPSRPSKARPVQRLQLFLHTAVVQEGRCGSHSLVFIPRGFGYLTVGAVATIQTALPFQTYMLPKTPTHVPFLFFKFLLFFFCFVFCFGLVLSRVCVMFTSLNLRPVFSQKGGLTLWHRTATEQGLGLVFTVSVKNRKKRRGKQS